MACFILGKKIARRTLTCDSTHVLGGTAALRVPYGLGGLQFFLPAFLQGAAQIKTSIPCLIFLQ